MAGQAGTRDLKVTSPHLFPVQTSRLCHLSPQESSIPAAHKRSKSFQTRPTRWGLGALNMGTKNNFARDSQEGTYLSLAHSTCPSSSCHPQGVFLRKY